MFTAHALAQPLVRAHPPRLRRPLAALATPVSRPIERVPAPAAEDHLRLVGRIAAADRDAFVRLFQHFAPRIKGFLRRQGMEPAAAEDLAQEVMLRVWRSAASFDAGKGSVGAWIYTIARNAHIDAVRRERHPTVEFEEEHASLDPQPPPDQVLIERRRAVRVRAALQELPADQAQVVEQSFFQHKPHAQIAADLDLPLGTVKSRLRLAFGRLRAALQGEQP